MYRVVSRRKRRRFERLSTLIAISILAGLLAGGAVGLVSARSANASRSASVDSSNSFQ